MKPASDPEETWEKMYTLYGPVLYNYGSKLTTQLDWVEDCIQDLFTELWEKKDRLEDIRYGKAYLIKSFRRKLVHKIQTDQQQKAHYHSSELQFHITFSFESSWIEREKQKEQESQLQKALSLLSHRQREAIFLKFYENHSYDEVADIMKIEKSAVYTLIYKAMTQLREVVKKTLIPSQIVLTIFMMFSAIPFSG